MYSDVRQTTCKLLEMVGEGVLDKDTVILACVNYMSETDVADMCRANDFIFDSDEEDEGE